MLFPMVPGHEIIGRVTAVGSAVTRFKPGDLAAVGVIVESCLHCANCKARPRGLLLRRRRSRHLQRHASATAPAPTAATPTPSSRPSTSSTPSSPASTSPPPRHSSAPASPPTRRCATGAQAPTRKSASSASAASAISALKFAHAFGAHVVQFTTSESKIDDAKKLGADEVVLSKDAAAMQKHAGSFDFILDCVSAPHDINAYLALLKLDGTLCLVGLPDQPLSVAPFSSSPTAARSPAPPSAA